jgi:hypothetical protein
MAFHAFHTLSFPWPAFADADHRKSKLPQTRLQGDTLQEHDWLALDGERIVILATPAIAFRKSGGRENYTQGAVN